ncbi:ATP-binding protein [Halorubrum trueperi]|uniref:ATP-binding protein n=1 Tax=Halorubrum trueperi TaxID=2004704 RepID=A0ABD5UKU3_9EURY
MWGPELDALLIATHHVYTVSHPTSPVRHPQLSNCRATSHSANAHHLLQRTPNRRSHPTYIDPSPFNNSLTSPYTSSGSPPHVSTHPKLPSGIPQSFHTGTPPSQSFDSTSRSTGRPPRTAGYSTREDTTGFGLSIVQQIVDAHDWHINVTDGDEGGTRFEISGVEFAVQ